MTAQGGHRVGADLDGAVDATGEVHPEEGEPRVGNRVHQVADELLRATTQREVLAAERDDANRRRGAGELGDPVGLETGASDETVGDDHAGFRPDVPSPLVAADGDDAL